jgi:hydrophobe/amphiphile efflux-3 (HAE3) family protein
MEHAARVLASGIRRAPVVLVAVTMCAAVALAFGIPRLKFQTGQDTLLDPNSKISLDNARFQRQFGGDPMLILFSAQGDSDIRQLFAPGNRATLGRLGRDIEATGGFKSVISPLTVLQFAQAQLQQQMASQPLQFAADQQKAEDAARAASIARGDTHERQDAAASAARQRVTEEFNAKFGADAKRFLAVGDQSLDNPAFVEFLMFGADGKLRPDLAGIFPDTDHALMVARLNGNVSIDQESRTAATVKDSMGTYQFDRVTALASGSPLLIKEINDKMKSALVVMAGLAVGIMMVVLSSIFRARWRLLSLPAVLVGCTAAFGLMGFLGIPLTMVTISGLPILIGLGVDFAIQVHSRLEEEAAATHSSEAGLERTFLLLGPALALAAMAACIGFLVLHLSRVPMVRDFGSMLAVGAVIVFISSTVLMSSIIYLREHRRIGPTKPVRARFEVERLVGGITARTVGKLVPIALAGALVATVGLVVSRRIPTQMDPEKFVPSSSSVLVDLHRVRDVAGTTSEINLLVEARNGKHVTDQDVLDWMLGLEESQRQKHGELKQSNSIASFTKSVSGAPPTTAAANVALSVAPQPLVDAVVNGDRTSADITFAISDAADLTERKAITNDILANAHPPDGISVAPAGIAVVGTETVEAISSNRDLMSLVAVGAILMLLLAVYRNPVKAVAPLLPVLVSLGASAMFLYFAGVQYSPLTSISGPLIIAMGTEFNILLMSRYFEERAAGLDPRNAMSKASLRIGRAIAASGLTVMGGFAVLALSDFPLLDNFGKVTALNIGLSLLSTLILLPPLLVWADGDHHFVRAAPNAVPE